MKKVCLVFILMALFGCSSGGGSSTAPSTAPTISNLRISPTTTALNDGGGAMTISLTVDFFDSEGDIDSHTIIASKFDVLGNSLGEPMTYTSSWDGQLSGKTLGTGTLYGAGDTTYIHTVNFSLFYTDKAGNNSNTLTGSWKVE